jgi:hypothetical protein
MYKATTAKTMPRMSLRKASPIRAKLAIFRRHTIGLLWTDNYFQSPRKS